MTITISFSYFDLSIQVNLSSFKPYYLTLDKKEKKKEMNGKNSLNS